MPINPFISNSYPPERDYEYSTDWEDVTTDHTYQDGGKSFNELSDAAPKRFERIYNFNLHVPGIAGKLAIFDRHYEAQRKSRPFDFLTKQGVLLTGVYYKEYEPNHDANQSWFQTRRIIFVKYDYVPDTVSETAPSVPTGLSAIPYSLNPTKALTISWNAATAFAGRTIASYKVKIDGGIIPDFITGLSVDVGFSTPSQSYSIQVAAVDSEGEIGPFSTAIIASTASVTPYKPADPVLIENNATRKVGITHALPWEEWLVSYNFGAFVQYPNAGGLIDVGDSARIAGYYRFKTRGATGRLESEVVSSSAFTAVAVPGNNAPVAQNVFITDAGGNAVYTVGELLTLNWDYFDAQGDDEGVHVYEWYRGNTIANGIVQNPSVIVGAVANTYTPTKTDAGKYIYGRVLPKASEGEPVGNWIASPPVGPIVNFTAPNLTGAIAVDTYGVDTIAWTTPAGYTDTIDVVVSIDFGATWNPVTGNPHPVGNIATQQDQVQVKIKSVTGRNESLVALKFPAFTYTPASGGESLVFLNDDTNLQFFDDDNNLILFNS